MSVLLFMVLKYLLLSSNDVLVYIKHQYHQHWQQHAFLMNDTLKRLNYCCISICNTLETILGLIIAQSSNKTGFLFWLNKKWSWDFKHFSSDLKEMSGKSVPLLFVCCISLWRDRFHNNQTQHRSIRICCTNVFRITYKYRKTLYIKTINYLA